MTTVRPASARGRCLCGAVRFTATLPSKWVAHCHCTLCQRAHGAAFVTWVGLESAAVALAAAEGSLAWFRSPAGGERGFCTACGSSMFFRADRWPGELHVARALFVDPVDREPQAHVYYDTHVPWASIVDELPRKPDPRATAMPVTPQLLDAFADAWNRHDADALMSFMTADCVFESSAGSDVAGTRYEGAAAVRAGYVQVWTTFPDAHWGEARHFVSGDRGVSQWTFTGTASDGRRVEVHGCDLFTFRDGKIALKDSYRKNRPPLASSQA